MEHNFIYEVKKGKKQLVKGFGYDEDLKNPVELKITIEEETINKLMRISDYYKLPTHEVITHLLSYDLEERIHEYEMILEGLIEETEQ